MSVELRNARKGESPVLVVLLILILLTMIALLVVMLTARSPQGGGPPADRAGNTGSQSSRSKSPKESPAAPEPPKPVGDPNRVRDVLQEGKTYETIVKTGLEAAVIDAAWGVRTTVNLVYATESRVRRTVERNDGKRVVLVCDVLESRSVKLVSDAEVRFDLGQPGFVILGFLDLAFAGGQGTAVAAAVGPIAEAVLTAASRALVNEATAKAKAAVDSLEGKKFRVTYVDGEGVVELEPIGCTLTEDEELYLKGLAVLSDCYILPDTQSRPGSYWDVNAQALMDYLPPSWRGRPRGVVTIERDQDYVRGGKQYAALQIRGGTFQVDASDQSRRRLASVTPRGRLEYNISDGYVESAQLNAQASMEEVSTDHLLFETRFETNPRIEIQYTCKMLGAADAQR